MSKLTPQTLKIETTNAPFLSLAHIEAETDPAALQLLEDKLRAYTVFTQAHKDHCKAVTYGHGDAAVAGTAHAREDAKVACPAVITFTNGRTTT